MAYPKGEVIEALISERGLFASFIYLFFEAILTTAF